VNDADSRGYWVSPETASPDGLVGVGGDLRSPTLVRAYCDGVFPWYNEGDPVLWWSPDPRAIIELNGLHISRSLARVIKSNKFQITLNKCFAEVMRACGENRDGGTWVTSEMLNSYTDLHNLGFAHSVETWVPDDESDELILAGGVYGVAIGGFFSAESMFYRVTDASKVALAALVSQLNTRGYQLLDVQMRTEHTTRMGAIDIPRADYLRRLKEAIRVQTRFN
jgi:leucyl/phenylalanyl-tRNA---protein transferase